MATVPVCFLILCLVLQAQTQSDPTEALWKPWLDLFTLGHSDTLLSLGKKVEKNSADFIAHDVPVAPSPFKPPPPPNFSASFSNALRGPSQSASSKQAQLYDFEQFGTKLFGGGGGRSFNGARTAHFPGSGSPLRTQSSNFLNNHGNNQNPFNLPQAQNFEILGENFGVPKGKDCIPYIGSVIKLLWRDCQKKAEALTWGQLGNQIQKALQGGRIDYKGALRETCKLQADRNFCETLGQQVLNCDIMGTLATTIEIQQAKERCDKVENFFQTARSDNVLGNIGNLIGSEVGSALIRNFFQG